MSPFRHFRRLFSLVNRSSRVLLPVLVGLFFVSSDICQKAPSGVRPIEDASDRSKAAEEITARANIKREENKRRENIERAKTNAQLASEVYQTLTDNESLTPSELKKLNRMERLSKEIRNESGGSADESALDNEESDLRTTLSRIATLSEDLRKDVEHTPRHVVSAILVRDANTLLRLIGRARTLAH